MTGGSSTSARGVAWHEYAIVLAAALIYLYFMNFRAGAFIYTLGQQEGGPWIDEAVRTLRGELIYRDFFEFLTPGIVYLNAAVLALLGPTTGSLGVTLVIVGALGTVAMHGVSAAVLPPYWRHVPAPLFAMVTYPSYSPGNHKWPAIVLSLFGLLAVVGARSRLRCAVAGVALGAATLFTQDFGVGAALGLGAALYLLQPRQDGADATAFLAAYGLTVGVTLSGLAMAAGLHNVWYAIVTFPLTQYPKAGHAFAVGLGSSNNIPIWLPAFGLGGAGLLYAGAGLLRRFWRSDPAGVVIVTLTGLGLMVVGGAAHQIEPTLFGARAVPLTIVGLLGLHRALGARLAHRWVSVGLLAACALLAIYGISRPVKRQFTATLRLETHRAGRIWLARPMPELDWLEAHTVEDQPVFMFPDKGGLFFLSRTRNVTSYPIMLDQDFFTTDQIADVVRQLDARCPAVGIWDRNRLYSVSEQRPEWFTLEPIYRTLLRDYDVAARLPNGTVGMVRRTPCAPARR